MRFFLACACLITLTVALRPNAALAANGDRTIWDTFNPAADLPADERLETGAHMAKIASGLQLHVIAKRQALKQLRATGRLSDSVREGAQINASPDRELVFVYLNRKPDRTLLAKLDALDVHRAASLWIPPVGRHRHGYILCDAPVSRIEALAKLPEVKRLDTGERRIMSQLDKAAEVMGAKAVWNNSSYAMFRGDGLRIGIIDTGYDVGNPDLPDPIATWRYDLDIDTNDNWTIQAYTNASVVDTFSGHGTYIASCIAGQGVLSRQSFGELEGIAPSANIHVVMAVFTNWATGPFFQNSMLAQALYDLASGDYVDMINMSLGEWDPFHDGSGPLEQAVDYLALNKGIPVICSAGNMGGLQGHASVNVPARQRSAGIPFQISSIGAGRYFSVVWHGYPVDPTGIELRYSLTGSGESTPTVLAAWTSPRDTSQRYQFFNGISSPSTRTEYLYITNTTPSNVLVHIYVDSYYSPAYSAPPSTPLRFTSADPNYTIASPGTADRAITIGATVSRVNFQNVSNTTTTATATTVGGTAGFSSRGPRVDQSSNPDDVQWDDYTAKPDCQCPGELVIATFDSNVRDTYGIPPWYNNSSFQRTLWYRSLPQGAQYRTNGVLNYICPLEVQNQIRQLWQFYPMTSGPLSYFTNRIYSGTSASSALGAGAAAMMLQRWPGLQVEELRRYMRPNRSPSETLPHYPGVYQFQDGFGALDVEDIFVKGGYVDEQDNFVHFLEPTVDNLLIQVTNNPLEVSGSWYNPYKVESFTISNYANGFNTQVDWVSLTNRTWWYDSVMLSNYALNELQVRWVAQGGLASDQQVASIFVEHRHGLARPAIAITNPTSASAYTISNSTGAVYLAGTWSDDSSVTGITWFSENLGSMGPASVYYGPSGTDGWWVANNVPLEELAFNTIDMTALDNDGDTRSAVINLTNGDGALPCDFTKVKYVINRKKPGKDKLKFAAEMGPGVDTGFAFDQATQFTLRIADTNGVYTNIFFEATPTKFNAKKGIYQLANPKLGKVVCKLKSSFGIVTLQVKCNLKNLTGLEQIINVPDADIPKKTPVDYEMPVNIRLTPHFCNKKADTKYFGKLGKKTVGSL